MIHNFLAWAGIYTDNAFPHVDGFWSTPIGLFITGSIFVCSTINIIHPGIEDDLFDRIWYSCVAMLMLMALIVGVNPGTNPHHLVQTLLCLLSIRFIVSVVQRHMKFKKTGVAQKTLGRDSKM